MKAAAIQQLLDSGAFTELDRHFARFVERLAGGDCPHVVLAAAMVSAKCAEGHVCVDLASCAGEMYPVDAEFGLLAVRLPKMAAWRAELLASGVVGEPGEFKPLILDGQGRLYLQRYWEYEKNLAEAISVRLRPAKGVNLDLLREGLQRIFPPSAGGEVDWQKVAAFAAVTRKFCVISGGPGTGKTRTVMRLLALLLEQQESMRIAIAAPTGKAAARLQESIKLAKGELNCAASVKARLPEEASTIHRLLGRIPHSPYFRRDALNPLPVDVVVIDEASMVDLALMAKLFAAIPPDARVILLGDKDQLSSVEAGAVLGDICAAGVVNSFTEQFCDDYAALTGETILPKKANLAPLADSLVQLQKNYRFGESNGMFALSRAVNSGDANEVVRLLDGTASDDAAISRRATPEVKSLREALRPRILANYPDASEACDPATALEQLQQFRILCALREGPYGVTAINRLVEEILIEAGRIKKSGEWYAGRPVMVKENDYSLELFNGDVGIALIDLATKQLRVFFSGPDGKPRAVPPGRLPVHETVHAMTVHKSQGSEFANVLLILPDRPSRILSRELIYTGLTRASRRVELWATESVLRGALGTVVSRASGLWDHWQAKKVSTSI